MIGIGGNPEKGNCPNCGAVDLWPVTWCMNDNTECYADDCPSYTPHLECPVSSNRLRCGKCEVIVDAE